MHKGVCGISPLAPGYSKIQIAPVPGEGVDWAKISLKTPQGTVKIECRLDDGTLQVEVTVPDGVEADVELLDGESRSVSGGTHRFSSAVVVAVPTGV